MSFWRIGDRGLLMTTEGPRSVSFADIEVPGEFPPVQNGRLWAGLSGSEDYERELLPMNVFKTARPWIGHLPGQYGGGDAAVQAVLDTDGYPTQMPAGVVEISTILLNIQSPQPSAVAVFDGRYRLLYDGEGTIDFRGACVSNEVVVSPGVIEFDFESIEEDGGVQMYITAINAANHLRNFRLFHTKHAARVAAGYITRPNFEWGELGLLRFMDLQKTNSHHEMGHAGVGTWPSANYYSWNAKGIPIENIVQIANELGINPWICIPHTANDAYVTRMATVVRDTLNPALKAYVEWSNETWNFGFAQTSYCRDQAIALFGGDGESDAAWFQYAGGRAAQCMDIFASVFAGQLGRIVRVAGLFTSYEGLEGYYLDAPLWVALGRPEPRLSFDAYAISGYFYSGIADEPVASDLIDVLTTEGTQAAIDFTMARLAGDESVNGSMAQLYGHWAYHRGVCNTRGMDLIMYEGGTHILAQGPLQDNAAVVNFMIALNYSPEMGEIYRQMLMEWDTVGDGGFNHFQTTIRPSRYGSWGAMRWVGDSNPRSDVLLEYNAAPLEATPELTPVALNVPTVVTGHSIPDAIFDEPWLGVLRAAGLTGFVRSGTGPYATAQYRWENDPAGPQQVRSVLEAAGPTSFRLFLGTEAHGGDLGGRASVAAHVRFSDAHLYALNWHNLAASKGCDTFYSNFWRNDPAQAWGSDWRASHFVTVDPEFSPNNEVQYWNGIIDYVNANRNPGTPAMRLVPWLEVFFAVQDAITAGTVTGITFASLFADDVHCDTVAGRWIQMATVMAVMFQRHPDQMPASIPLQYGGFDTISSGLAAQLRPVIWEACRSNPRAGLA